MRVDVGGRGNVAMPQPLLNIFQADTVRIQQARAAVAKIVETDLSQSMLFQKQREMLRDVAGLYQFRHSLCSATFG